MIDNRERVMMWCHHRDKPSVRYKVECLKDGSPVRYAMGRDHDENIVHGFKLIVPAPPDCGPHMEVEFGLIDERVFEELYEMEDDAQS